jgi:alpha-tubulin suppressor-like RCC1 family protein
VALGRDGTAWWWGYDAVLGKTAVPLRAGAIAGAVGISAGQQHSCAVTGQGAVWCWGLGGNGRLGHGRTDNADTPVMADVTGAGQVSAGQRHTCAVLKDGPIHCWGYNDVGQLGNGTRDGSLRPAPVPLGCP